MSSIKTFLFLAAYGSNNAQGKTTFQFLPQDICLFYGGSFVISFSYFYLYFNIGLFAKWHYITKLLFFGFIVDNRYIQNGTHKD
jgi:hypothetical protein